MSVLRWEGPVAPRRYLPPICSARRFPLIGGRDATPPPPARCLGARVNFSAEMPGRRMDSGEERGEESF